MIRAVSAASALLGALSLQAAPPVLEALFPAGGQAGSSFVLTANGKLEDDAALWIDCPNVHFVPNGKKREWQVTLLPDARPGLHLVRAYNRDGASDARWFSIGALPEIAEAEPNNEVGKGQAVAKLPVCINARLEKSGDVDGYTVQLAAGQTLVALVEAYALGAPVDVMAHIVDGNGARVLTVSDGRNLDPQIVFKAPATGGYTVQLAGFVHPPQADVRFTGATTAVYRLHLTTAPVVTGLAPAVAVTQTGSEVELRGLGLDPKKLKQALPAMSGRGEIVSVPVPNALQPLQVVAAAKAGILEVEPNNDAAKAMSIKAGDSVSGSIGDKDPHDRYTISAKKGDRLSLRIFARRLGSPLDAVLEVVNAEGKSLLSLDDSGENNSDPQGDWAVAADGDYQVSIKDRFGRGGDAFFYVFQALPAVPQYKLTLPDGKPIVVEAGKSVTLKATSKITGDLKAPLVCRVAGLPPGVHAAEVAVPAKGGEVSIKVEAAAEARDYQGPIYLTVWTNDGHFNTATYPLRGENLRGTSLLDEGDSLWLTIKGK